MAKTSIVETTHPLGGGDRPRPGQRQDGHMPLPALPRARAGHRRRATRSSRPSPSGTCPLKHPVNLAYEAATVDLDDANTIDPFHLEAYGETTVNYNRGRGDLPGAQGHDGAHPGHVPLPVPHRHGREHGRQWPSSTTRHVREAAEDGDRAPLLPGCGRRRAAPAGRHEHVEHAGAVDEPGWRATRTSRPHARPLC